MYKSKKEYVYKLLYSENKKDTIDEIKSITDSELLHIIAGNYNWDNGFEIPYNIINNKELHQNRCSSYYRHIYLYQCV